MEQYLELLRTIKEKGTYKPAAREGMPGTQSLFGYQFRHNLQDGFPMLTTKKIFWKAVVIELLWFLRGDTNIKYLVDNGVNIWNEDAYNYYLKKCRQCDQVPYDYDLFLNKIKTENKSELVKNLIDDYSYGDCGFQYGKVWRKWKGGVKGLTSEINKDGVCMNKFEYNQIDQIQNVINSLRNSPEGRRHIVTAWDPAHDQDLALTWCHALFQFNCRPLTMDQRISILMKGNFEVIGDKTAEFKHKILDNHNIPRYYLDCQLYQRSADVFLGVPFNIASYALLTHIIAKMCNMIPEEFIHTFGDVHIYDNHKQQVDEQLKRIPTALPQLNISNIDWVKFGSNLWFDRLNLIDFDLINYNPQAAIRAELSTGLKK